MRIVVLGGTGMLGFQFFKLCLERGLDIHAVVRNRSLLVQNIDKNVDGRVHQIDDVKDLHGLEKLLARLKPDYLINCVGIVKQSHLAYNYLESIAVNSLLPHQLQELGQKIGFRLIHISTDCVFDGAKGFYKESDPCNATDLYGKSKHLGEVDYGCGLTIRTSIIGHEIVQSTHGLVEWFLSQNGPVNGFTSAIFSGLTTLELSKVILNLIDNGEINNGLYQVAAEPISKHDLITLIAKSYNKEILINPSSDFKIDRSLDGSLFRNKTGYSAPDWIQMVNEMRDDYMNNWPTDKS